jgi:hypothetical protein
MSQNSCAGWNIPRQMLTKIGHGAAEACIILPTTEYIRQAAVRKPKRCRPDSYRNFITTDGNGRMTMSKNVTSVIGIRQSDAERRHEVWKAAVVIVALAGVAATVLIGTNAARAQTVAAADRSTGDGGPISASQYGPAIGAPWDRSRRDGALCGYGVYYDVWPDGYRRRSSNACRHSARDE